MSDYTIINDLTESEEEKLYDKLPCDKYRYVMVADVIKDLWQPFFDEKCIGIVKSNDNVAQLESRDIAVLGYESTRDEFLTTSYVVEDLGVVERRDLDIVYSRFHNLPLYILETKRCILREHTLEDYDAIYNLYRDESMTKYIEPLFPPDEEREYLKNYIELIYKLFGYGLWLIIDKVTGEVIGRAGVENKESCRDISEVELSYQVKKQYQNKGIATEVCKAIIDYTFDRLNKKTIIARIDKDNIASMRVAIKTGFEPLEEDLYIRCQDDKK